MTESKITPKGIITVRQAIADDAELVRELRLEALMNHPNVFASDHASAAKESVQAWADRITNYASRNQGMIAIASSGDRLVGMTGLFRDDNAKTRHNGGLYGVYVNEDWRGLRIADALIEECVLWAQKQQLATLKLGVITTNSTAIRCYTRCGFTTYGTDPKVIYYDGVFYDEFLMAKAI